MTDPGRPDGLAGTGPGLHVQSDAGVAVVTLDRPHALNAVDEPLHGALTRVWGSLDADPEVRAAVITGRGRAFCGGGDLDLLERMTTQPDLRARIMEEGAEIVRAMTSVSIPMVAAVNGPAVGLGCSLAGMCDLVLVEEQAYFADPHVALGLVAADGGTLTWPLLTSLLRAKEHLLLGDRLSAADAVTYGLANRVVPTGTSRQAAEALARRLAALPPQAVRETKALLNKALRSRVATALPAAIAAETASFDEPVFRRNLAAALVRSRTG